MSDYLNYFAQYKTPGPVRKNKKTRLTSGRNPYLGALRASVLNPFSLSHARIPDGKHWLSNAIKTQTVFEITFGDKERLIHQDRDANWVSKFPKYAAKDVVDMLFFPGFNNMLMIQTGKVFSPIRYRYPDEGGSTLNDQDAEPNRSRATPAGRFNAKILSAPIPVPLYAHDQFRVTEPIPIDDNDPDGPDPEAGAVPIRRHRVAGFSETVTQPFKNTRVEKWRLVSCGLRLSCTNNATNNAGWWEAQRVNVTNQGRDFMLMPAPSGIDSTLTVEDTNNPVGGQREAYETYHKEAPYYITGPIKLTKTNLLNLSRADGIANGDAPENLGVQAPLPLLPPFAEMANNATYTSGKVRDLHKHVFKLRPSGDEHPYKEFPDQIRRSNMGDNWPFSDQLSAIGESDENAFIDDVYDAIHIRIHSQTGTNIMGHYVANQELVHDENSNMARTAERTELSAADWEIADVYNSGIPANATSVSMSLKRY